ncbi:MAG: hypothetical protein AAB361_03215 [Patescibacteria group bacterium]
MAKKISKQVNILIGSKKIISSCLKRVIKNNSFNYRTFGVDIEPHISSILVEIFKKKGLIKSEKDYVLAPDKNYFSRF